MWPAELHHASGTSDGDAGKGFRRVAVSLGRMSSARELHNVDAGKQSFPLLQAKGSFDDTPGQATLKFGFAFKFAPGQRFHESSCHCVT